VGTTEKSELLSLSALARELKISPNVAVAMHDSGVLKEDFKSGNILLFRPERLEELRAAAAKPFGLSKAIAARKAQLEKTGK
jgi:hypothetical protein